MSIDLQPNITKVISRKFDGTINRTWNVEFISKQESLLTFVGIFADDINHSKLGLIRRGTISYEYYWLDKWFNVFKFQEPNGDLRNYYCNINLPPKFHNSILDYVDLDIDILVGSSFEVEILDLDEFEENSIKYSYPDELIQKTHHTLYEVLKMIEVKDFPFSQKIGHYPDNEPFGI